MSETILGGDLATCRNVRAERQLLIYAEHTSEWLFRRFSRRTEGFCSAPTSNFVPNLTAIATDSLVPIRGLMNCSRFTVAADVCKRPRGRSIDVSHEWRSQHSAVVREVRSVTVALPSTDHYRQSLRTPWAGRDAATWSMTRVPLLRGRKAVSCPFRSLTV